RDRSPSRRHKPARPVDRKVSPTSFRNHMGISSSGRGPNLASSVSHQSKQTTEHGIPLSVRRQENVLTWLGPHTRRMGLTVTRRRHSSQYFSRCGKYFRSSASLQRSSTSPTHP